MEQFQEAADQLDKRLLYKKQIEVAVVLYEMNTIVLKLYKKSWASPFQDPLTAASKIFFSVWISDSAIREQKLLYNIHALKLRQLKNYSIQSRKFAGIFRNSFKAFAHTWENVNVQVGPLTLMEGWLKTNPENLQRNIVKLANGFLEIEHLVDNTLVQFKRTAAN